MSSPKEFGYTAYNNRSTSRPMGLHSAIPSPPRSSSKAGIPPVTAPRNTQESKTKPLTVTPENELGSTVKKGLNESNKSSPMHHALRPPPRGTSIFNSYLIPPSPSSDWNFCKNAAKKAIIDNYTSALSRLLSFFRTKIKKDHPSLSVVYACLFPITIYD